MLSLGDAIFGLGLPALVGIVLLLVGRKQLDTAVQQPIFWRYTAGGPAVFAIGIAFLLGCSALNRTPSLPPKDATDWLYLAAMAMLPLAAIHQFVWRSRWFWHVACLLILAGAIGGIISLLPVETWTVAQKIIWAGGCWLAAAAVTLGLSFLPSGSNDPSNGVVTGITAMALVSALGAVALAMSGSQVYGQVAAILPATLIPVVLLAFALRTTFQLPDVAPLFVLLFGGMLLSGYLFAELTAVNALLLFFSPLMLWVGRIPAIRNLNGWQRGAIQILAVLIPSGIAFGLALHKFLIDMAAAPEF